MHVSMEYFAEVRPADLAWTIDPANFSHTLSIYSGHFLDLLFQIVGPPDRVNAIVKPQFPTLTLTSTGEVFPNRTPDQVVVIGTLKDGGVLTVQIEGGKRNNSGLQIDITGTSGDLKVWNTKSFGNASDNVVEGARGDGGVLHRLAVPAEYRFVPASSLDESVLDLAHLYAAHARDREEGTRLAPGFADAVRIHRFIERVGRASETGTGQVCYRYLGWRGGQPSSPKLMVLRVKSQESRSSSDHRLEHQHHYRTWPGKIQEGFPIPPGDGRWSSRPGSRAASPRFPGSQHHPDRSTRVPRQAPKDRDSPRGPSGDQPDPNGSARTASSGGVLSFRTPPGPVCRRLRPVAADRHAAPAPGVGLRAVEEHQRAGRALARPDQPEILIADQVRRRFGDRL